MTARRLPSSSTTTRAAVPPGRPWPKRTPFWKTEDSEYILKCKTKYAPKKDLEDNGIVTVNIIFKYYCMETDDDKLLQGYYIKNLTYEEDKEN